MAALLGLSACSKDQEKTLQPADECITRASANYGRVIEGEYIVTYQSDEQGLTSVPNARAEVQVREWAVDLLSRHRIAASSIRQTFAGQRSGFAGKLSAAEVAELQRDPEVISIEPDRIVSIAACFTVVDERRVTWSAKQTGRLRRRQRQNRLDH